MKLEINSRRFAQAWEAMLIAAPEDSDNPVLLELFDDHGFRLIATDGYVLARTWIPLDDEAENLEPEISEVPDVSFVIGDPDLRGFGLLRYIRKLHKKVDDPGVPKLTLTRLQDDSDQGVLDGMETELLHFSWPLHEDVSLPILDRPFPDWRHISNDRVPAAETKHIAFTSLTLGSLAKLAELYKGYTVDWTLRGSLGVIDFSIGPVVGHLMPTKPTAPDQD